jgi:disulfide bond formation protein DsbB
MSYHNNINPFENYSGSMNLSKPGYLLLLFASLSIVACCETWDYWDYFSIRTAIWVVYYLFCYPIIGFIPPSH